MAQKTFSKHSEYRTYSTKGAYDDGDFDNMKSELLPSKYGSLIQPGNGTPAGTKEYYYEYKEQKDPAGTYDRKDLHTVEQYEFSNSPSNRYMDSGRPAITSTPHRHVTSSTTSTVRKGDLTQNIEELDSLLDDLQRDQERKPYKSGYSSDTMESSSFDYRSMNTPVKSSGYSTLSKVDRDVEWLPAPAPTQALSGTITREVNREVIRNVTESHVVPVAGQSVPAVVCDKCHGPPTVQVQAGVPMNKVTTTVKTYTYEVPADQDPAVLPIPGTTAVPNTQQDKYLSTDRNYVREDQEHRTYVNTQFNASTPVGSPIRQPSPLPPPSTHYRETTTTTKSGPPPHVCPHVDSHTRTHTTHTATKNTSLPAQPAPPPHTCLHCSQKLTTVTSVQSCPNCPTLVTGGTPHVCPNCSAPGTGWSPHVCPNCSTTGTGGPPHTCPNCPATGPGGSPHVCPTCPKTGPGQDTSKITTRTTHYTTNTVDNQRYPENRYPDNHYPDNRYPENRSPDNRYPENRSPYSAPASPPYAVPTDQSPKQPNQGPPGTVYKYTTTNYTYNSSNDGGPPGGPSPSPFPVDGRRGTPSPFPRTESPAPRMQEPPKRLNDLLADFPGHENYPPENDLRKRPNPARGPGGAVNGLGHEKAAVQTQASKAQDQKALSLSKNIAGPAVYYPPGHETFARKDEAAAYQQAGGGYMKAKGNYKYEAESSSKSKSSSGAAVVPVCLPLCCAMPCVLL